jgi:hypothetical protein
MIGRAVVILVLVLVAVWLVGGLLRDDRAKARRRRRR